MTEKEKKLHKQIEELSIEIIMLRNHIKETLKSQNRDCAKWFSIKDRMPETGITSEYGSDWVLAFDGENIYMSKYIKLVTKQFWKEVYTDAPLSITHWMPLPSPPSPPSSSNSE